MSTVVMLSVLLVSVRFEACSECHYAECRYADCCGSIKGGGALEPAQYFFLHPLLMLKCGKVTPCHFLPNLIFSSKVRSLPLQWSLESVLKGCIWIISSIANKY
jgi:hypothetical protein